MMNKLTSLLALLCIPFCMTYAQSDEINISAAFSSSIDLRIASGANINFTFTSLDDYQNGKSGTSIFEVASSVSFSVAISMTAFTNSDGEELELKNLSYRIGALPGDVNEEGVRWIFSEANTSSPKYINSNGASLSGVHFATTSPHTVLAPGPVGNAGSYEDNKFFLNFHLGVAGHQVIPEIDLPPLLDQNIAPGTYTCTVTLEAIPEAL